MQRRAHVALLARIAEIRDLQRTAAEAQAVRAAAARRDAHDVQRKEENKLRSVEQGWQDSLAAPLRSTEVTRLWSAEMMRQVGVVRAAEVRLGEATAEAERRQFEWTSTLVRRDAARDIARDAARRLARHRDEKALGDVADRHAHRGRGR